MVYWEFVWNICFHVQVLCTWSYDIRNKFTNLKIPLKYQNKEIGLCCVNFTKWKNSGEVSDDEQTTLSLSIFVNRVELLSLNLFSNQVFFLKQNHEV